MPRGTTICMDQSLSSTVYYRTKIGKMNLRLIALYQQIDSLQQATIADQNIFVFQSSNARNTRIAM